MQKDPMRESSLIDYVGIVLRLVLNESHLVYCILGCQLQQLNATQ